MPERVKIITVDWEKPECWSLSTYRASGGWQGETVMSRFVKRVLAMVTVAVLALTAAGLNRHWAELYQEMTHGFNVGHVTHEGGSARPVRGSTEIDVVLKRLVR